MKSYLYLSLLFALTVSTTLFAQDKKESKTKAPQENFKIQYKLKELSKDIQKTEKQLNKNQRENISAIEAVKAKTENLKEQNKKLQKDTSQISSELNKVLNRKIFELKTRQEIIDYQGKELNMWLTTLAIVVAVLTVIISIFFFFFSNKLWKQGIKADAIQKELDDLIKSKKDEFDDLIENKENEFKNFTKNIKSELKKIIEEQKTCSDLANRAFQAGRDKNYSKAIDLYTQLIKIDPENYSAYMHRGVAYVFQEDFTKAIQKDFTQAINDYKETIRLKPDYVSAYVNLIELLIITNSFEEANKYLQQVRKYKLSVQDESIISILNTIVVLAERKEAKVELEQFEKVLKSEVYLGWRFDELDWWLESPEFEASPGFKNKSKIQDVIDRYKTCKAALKAK